LYDIENAFVPSPPIEVQQSVVSELDKINELISLKKAQLNDLDVLAQSIFYDMFGDPVENEKGWEVKKIGDICTDMKYGTSKPACINGQYKYLRMCNLTYNGYLDLSDIKTIDIPDDEIEKCIVRKGDILFNRTNSIELVGKTCMFEEDEPMVIAGYIIRVRLNEYILPVYLTRSFNLPSMKKIIRNMAKGAVNQANINSKQLASIHIPLPPLSLQQTFAKRIEVIEQQKQQINKTIKDLETLLASRMQYWFD
jgi:type I restriction enzyme S subunit